MNAGEVSQSEGDAAREPSVTKALRLAHSLGASIDELVERIYWNPGEIAAKPSDRRPFSERLAGFFLVLPANVPVYESAVPRAPIASRHEAATIFGRNLREARERRHLTQTTLARSTGLSKAGLSLIERGVNETTIETMLSLARGLQVAPESLLGGITWKARRPPPARPSSGGAQRHTAHSLDGTVRRLWCEGRTAREIGASVGASPGSVSAIVHRLREHGHEMPYRSPPTRAVHEGARERRQPHSRQMPDSDRAAEQVAWTEFSHGDVAARIGANVARLRHKRGLTKEQLGEAIESDRTYLHRIETGRNVPRLALIVKLAASLNVRCRDITAGVLWQPDSGRFCLDPELGVPMMGIARLGQNVRESRRGIDVSQQALGISGRSQSRRRRGFRAGQAELQDLHRREARGHARGRPCQAVFGRGGWYVRPLPAPEYAPGDPAPGKAERDALLMRLWREGKSEREIAEALDLASCAVAPYVRELRDAGLDLPHRRAPRTPIEAAARRRRDACSRESSRS
jgi:transcriptional regulator with XRE-family HTH domain